VRYFVFAFLFIILADLEILTIHATHIAEAEENISRAVSASEAGFLAKVCDVRGNDREFSGEAGGDLAFKAIDAAISRADIAIGQTGPQSVHAAIQFARSRKGKKSRFKLLL